MITILGVGHVFDIGPRIRREMLERRPSIVCLELDEARLNALRARRRQKRVPTLYNMLSLIQAWIAQRFGGRVGDEMLAAYDTALELGVPVSLIDIDSLVTWQRLRSSLGPLEAVKLLASGLTAIFIRRERIERELDAYREDYDRFMRSFEKGYPSVKRVLVDERNAHMAGRIRELHDLHGDLMAVVGDGHVEGLKALLAGQPLEAIRLWDLRSGESSTGGTSASL